MAGRAGPPNRAPSRGGQCAVGPSRGSRNPGLTRAAQLRQAKSAAFVKEQMAKEEALAAQGQAPCAAPSKARVPRFTKGPPPAEPRRIQMTKPSMTKAMLARMKHAEEFTKNLEKQRGAAVFQKKPATRVAPVGREPRRRPPTAAPPCVEPRGEDWRPQGALQEAAASHPAFQRLQRMREERMAASRGQKKGTCGEAGPSSAPGPCPKSPQRKSAPCPQAQSTMRQNRQEESLGLAEEQSGISEKTCELAQSMNADILQAESVGEGPVQNIVIPPGAVSQCRTTIVALPPQGDANSSANRSMQIITETLDDQDALEAAAVNSRLSELQNARRDFVLAVANVGNNVINVADHPPSPCAPARGLYELPDAEDDMFRLEYGREHPNVIAAREFRTRSRAMMHERENQMRIEREFARAARHEGGLRLDIPIEQEIMEGDISFEEDESGMVIPCASRIKASMPRIPRKNVAAVPDAILPEELERFFNPAKYPMSYDVKDDGRAPPGREELNPDLWELDDPWYRECSQPQVPDLIDFNDY